MEEDLGLRIAIERTKKRLKQRHVAVLAGMTHSRLSDIERGWKVPTQEQIEAICSSIGITPSDLGPCLKT